VAWVAAVAAEVAAAVAGNTTMRLWSIHPKYLDSKGLVALWREALLAKKVLQDETKGYTQHPQLQRFKSAPNALDAINFYLLGVWEESKQRGFSFDSKKIDSFNDVEIIKITNKQVEYEFQHLLKKLKTRDIAKFHSIAYIDSIEVHPLFRIVEGDIEKWENI